MAFRILRRLQDLLDVNSAGLANGDVPTWNSATSKFTMDAPTGGGAPTTADYLTGTAQAGLSAEIVVGTSPGGELGGTWASPTVDATHSGSSHASVQAAAEATAAAALTTHEADTTNVHGVTDTSTLYRSGGTDVAVADGGTGASTAAAARTNLGLVIATDIEAHDSDLTTIAGLSPTNDDVIQRKTGAWTNRTMAQVLADLAAVGTTFQPLDSDLTAIAALTTTSFGRSLLALADAAATRTALSLVPGTDIEAHDSDLTTIAGLSATNDDVIQRKAGAWTNRTVPQLLVDLAAAGTTFQPLDSDLTAIAALTTTSFGRAFLALADAAATRTAISAAPLDATFITQTASSELSGEQALGSLATGVLKNTTTTGVLSIATEGTDYYKPGGTDVAIADGGTGSSTASGARTNLGLAIGTDVPAQATFDDHSARHESGGADAIKIDDLAAGDDNTDLNASTSKHGLLPKLDNSAVHFLNGQGAWATPAGGAVATDAIFDAKGDLAVGTGADTAAKLTVGTDAYVLVADSSQSTGLKWRNIGWTEVVKGSDESVTSSTTPQDDDALFFTAASGIAYEIVIVLLYASPSGGGTPDIKIQLGEDTTLRGAVITSQALGTGDAPSSASMITTQGSGGSSQVLHGTAATKRLSMMRGFHVGGGGTFKVQWAQNTSDANAVTVYTGSVLRYRRIN